MSARAHNADERRRIHPEDVAARLRGYRLALVDEKRTQADIARVLADLDPVREFRLSPGDIVDLMVGSCAIEVKLRAERAAILRQIERYLTHDAITGLVLVTATAIRVPLMSFGKPVCTVSLGAAWL